MNLKSLLLGAGLIAAVSPFVVLSAVVFNRTETPSAPASAAPQAALAYVPASRNPPEVPHGNTVEATPTSREEFTLPRAHVWGRETTMGEFTIRAVSRYWAGPAPEVLTLERAIESGACAIRETGRLDTVTAEVSGTMPVLALVGDLLFGGRQDRLVARSAVLEPGLNTIQVFTAELQRKPEEQPRQALLPDFACTQVDLNVKAAVFMDGSQSGVSLAIAQMSGAFGSYRETVASRSDEVDAMVARAARLVWAFTVGFFVYKGDKLIAADLFNSTQLLEQVADKLLRSYAMTAVYGDISNWTAEPEPPAKAAPTAPSTNTPDIHRPKANYVIRDDDLIRRECRRTPNDRPIHTGIFRR